MVRAYVEIGGLRELRAALKSADAALPKTIRLALNQASELVITYAKRRIPKRSGRAAGSLKVRSSQTRARVAAGGSRAPYYPWLDFGGHVGQHGATGRPFYTEGRYIYPGLRENRDKITETMESALTELARGAGFEVT